MSRRPFRTIREGSFSASSSWRSSVLDALPSQYADPYREGTALAFGWPCAGIEIGAVPATTSLPQQVADDPVVRPDVQTGLSGGILQ